MAAGRLEISPSMEPRASLLGLSGKFLTNAHHRLPRYYIPHASMDFPIINAEKLRSNYKKNPIYRRCVKQTLPDHCT